MAPAPAKISEATQVCTTLATYEPKFQAALPPQVPVKKFVRVAQTAIQNAPTLLQADRASLYNACMKAAQDGLLPDGREAALVTFGNSVQYMPMVGGILKKARNSGEIASISAHIVYKGEEFSHYIDEKGEHMRHVPSHGGDRKDTDITHAYAMALTKDGGVYLEIMNKAEIDQVRNVSRSGSKGPWATWYSEMAKKTVIRRGSKRWPMSTDLEQVVERDDELYQQEEVMPEAPTEPSKTSRRAAKVVEATVAPPAPDMIHEGEKVVFEAPEVEAGMPEQEAPI